MYIRQYLVAHDVLHSLKKVRHGDDGFMTIKIGMSKYCDRVDWKFLRMMMLKMGFDENWIGRVMRYVE